MAYFKSALFGIAGSVLAVVIVIAALFRLSYGEGAGALSVSVGSVQIVIAALVGFVAGFWWKFRRLRLRQA
jgi:hypothetical protein